MPTIHQTITLKNGKEVLDWPGNSPDLNPIEEAWNGMKKTCGRLKNNKEKLCEGIATLCRKQL